MWRVTICSIFLAPLLRERLEVYIYLAWTSFLLMVQRSLRLSCGALNARALYGHIHFWGHDSVGQRHLLMRTPTSCFSASIEFQSSKQRASLLICCSMAISWMKYVFERFFHSLFQTLLPVKTDWFVNSVKFKSWPEATYLSWSLTR